MVARSFMGVEPLGLLEEAAAIEFDPAGYGEGLIRRAIQGTGVKGLQGIASRSDVWWAALMVTKPVTLEVALGLFDAAVALDESLKEATRRKYRGLVTRMVMSAVHRDVTHVEDLTTGLLGEILGEATQRHGRWISPSTSTQRTRRYALRYFFAKLIDLGVVERDPVHEVMLPSRSPLGTRPLTDQEMELCEAAAFDGFVPGRRPVALALVQSGAAIGEAAHVRAEHVDRGGPRLVLPGSAYTGARTNAITGWAHDVLLAAADDMALRGVPDRPLVVGPDVACDSATSLVSGYLREVLAHARIIDRDVRPSSVRAWGARSVYDRAGLEAAREFLGLESFDRTADLIGLERQR